MLVARRKVDSQYVLCSYHLKLIDSPFSMVEYYVEAFSSVFAAGTPLHPVEGQVFHRQMKVQVGADEIFSTLAELYVSSAMGLDGIHPRILKYYAFESTQTLLIIFQRSLRYTLVPKLWIVSLLMASRWVTPCKIPQFMVMPKL